MAILCLYLNERDEAHITHSKRCAIKLTFLLTINMLKNKDKIQYIPVMFKRVRNKRFSFLHPGTKKE